MWYCLLCCQGRVDHPLLMLHKVVLTFESVADILKCSQSQMKAIEHILSCGAVYYSVQDGSNF